MDERQPEEGARSLDERVARLEAEVARLRAEMGARVVTPPARLPARPAATAAASPAASPSSATGAPPLSLPPPPPPPSRAPGATSRSPRERNPVTVVAAAGAAIFLLGAIFLLRFAIQQGWLGPEARFLFGIAVGIGLTLPAVRHLRGGRPGLGTALLAAGLGTLVFTLYVGCFRYGFYRRELGFALAAGACVLGGALAARVRAQSAFLVAYLAAFASPFVFAGDERQPIELTAFELALFAAALYVAHVTPAARAWTLARWSVVVTQGLVLLGTAADARAGEASMLLLLLALALAMGAVWIWRRREVTTTADSPTPLWVLVSLGAVAAAALDWQALGWSRESFALVLVGLAGLQGLLSWLVRRRTVADGTEVGLLVLAGALLGAAVPVAWGWERTGPLWGLMAVLALWGAGALAARRETRDAAVEPEALALVGTGLAGAASLRWLGAFSLTSVTAPLSRAPFWNDLFLTAVLASLAWLLLARSGRQEERLGFLAGEGLGNLALAFEIAALVGWLGGSDRARLVTPTLVWAASGAAHWLLGLRRQDELGRGLVLAGYVGLAVAAGKLVLVDLDEAPLALRALVFLGAGGIFLGAALIADRLARERSPADP